MNLKYLNIKIGSQFSYFRNLNFQKHYFLGLTGKEPCTIGKSWIRIRGPLLCVYIWLPSTMDALSGLTKPCSV